MKHLNTHEVTPEKINLLDSLEDQKLQQLNESRYKEWLLSKRGSDSKLTYRQLLKYATIFKVNPERALELLNEIFGKIESHNMNQYANHSRGPVFQHSQESAGSGCLMLFVLGVLVVSIGLGFIFPPAWFVTIIFAGFSHAITRELLR